MKKHNKKKMTYRELLAHIDQRDEMLMQRFSNTERWISTVEHMVKWLIEFLFSKRRKKKFDEYVKQQQEEQDAISDGEK
jgi:hypothetical protein